MIYPLQVVRTAQSDRLRPLIPAHKSDIAHLRFLPHNFPKRIHAHVPILRKHRLGGDLLSRSVFACVPAGKIVPRPLGHIRQDITSSHRRLRRQFPPVAVIEHDVVGRLRPDLPKRVQAHVFMARKYRFGSDALPRPVFAGIPAHKVIPRPLGRIGQNVTFARLDFRRHLLPVAAVKHDVERAFRNTGSDVGAARQPAARQHGCKQSGRYFLHSHGPLPVRRTDDGGKISPLRCSAVIIILQIAPFVNRRRGKNARRTKIFPARLRFSPLAQGETEKPQSNATTADSSHS